MKAKILVMVLALVLAVGISAAQGATAANLPVVLTGTTAAGSNTILGTQLFQISPDGVLATTAFVPPANFDLVITEFTLINGSAVDLKLGTNLIVSVQKEGWGPLNFRMQTGFAVSATGLPLFSAVIYSEEREQQAQQVQCGPPGPATLILRGLLVDPPVAGKKK
jgi:hypothetical protein